MEYLKLIGIFAAMGFGVVILRKILFPKRPRGLEPKVGTDSWYEPFSPGDRVYPPLTTNLFAHASIIPPTHDWGLTYCPCSAILNDGRRVDCVYLVEAAPYIKIWGIWPDQDKGKLEVKIGDVTRIEPSPYCLPAKFAQQLYDAGASGMGYTVFEIQYRDGSRSAHLTGNAVDFVNLSSGKVMSDIHSVHPHKGRNSVHVEAPNYYWCLYSKDEGVTEKQAR
jgi:hypothetical protein